jgi:hypothetical protein
MLLKEDDYGANIDRSTGPSGFYRQVRIGHVAAIRNRRRS